MSAPSFSTRLKNIFTPKRVRVLKKMAAGMGVSSVPVLIWWKWSCDQRNQRAEDVRTRVRVPNVQTIDDLMIERCRPGDILLFDRRWETCASGPMAALVCIFSRTFLCKEDNNKVSQEGKFDHCGELPGLKTREESIFDFYLFLKYDGWSSL